MAEANVNSPDPSHYGSPTIATDGTVYQGSSEHELQPVGHQSG
jgi:hypothetical protein